MIADDSYWMQKAIETAREGGSRFGTVITDLHGNVISAFNTTNRGNSTFHAEMNALQRLNELSYDHASELTLYTTVEPCPMCMGGIIWAGIGMLRYGLSIEYVSEHIKQIMVPSRHIAEKSWREIDIHGGIEEDACIELWHRKR